MRIVHGLGWYFPHSTGGTENHVAGLAGGLDRRGIETSIVVPAGKGGPESYRHRGIKVDTYLPVGDRSPAAFEAVLSRLAPDIYHQHAWTAQSGLAHVAAARRLGIKTALTILVPANMCIRGTLMRHGREVCRGPLTEAVCASCLSEAGGAPAALAALAPHVPLAVSGLADKSRALRSALPFLAARARSARKIADFHAMVDASDVIIVVADWLRQTFADNGIAAPKVALCKMGLDDDFQAAGAAPRQGNEFRICFFGRFDPVKGIDTIIAAVRALPQETPVALDIYGLANTKKDQRYRSIVRDLAGDDARITFKDAIPPEQVLPVLQGYDAMAVPSKWLETGPLVVLEAIEAGVHVLGSNLGGIAELVTPGETGTLLPAFEPAAWSAAISVRMSAPRGATPGRKARRMATVVDETLKIYADLLFR